MTPFQLEGLIAATHTPFNADGSLNLDAVESQATHLARHGIRHAFIAGSTGEWSSLTAEERRLLASRWTDVTRHTPLDVIVHVGANCLEESAALAAHAQSAGAVAVSALAPSYYKPRDVDTLIACCAPIAAAAPRLPFYYYDIPAMTGVSLSMPEFLERGTRRIPTLAGLKYTSLDPVMLQDCLQHESMRIAWGVDEALLAALALGVRSAVGSTYNFAAPLAHKAWQAFNAGNWPAARAAQLRIVRLVQTLARYGYLPAAKVVMQRLGVDAGPTRLPLPPLPPARINALEQDLDRIGFWSDAITPAPHAVTP
ncbi:MAG TPA: dihydrodipicolinate synthase family protein [Verrucomicrobiota bacterium]|nr:dihydrodipicolinate synthase family protein [Verrucomicrobiota bacterium]HNU52796.1 dihydrodipicolinate synthase family protein [Verrucomicrobiota bacterium]